jgi:hypothetical protein
MRDFAVTTVTRFTLTGLVLFVFAVWTRHSLLVLLLHMAQNTINYRREFSAACSGSLGISLAMFSSVSKRGDLLLNIDHYFGMNLPSALDLC